MCLLFAFEIIILCEAEAFKNRIWYFKTWEDVAWQPVVGMQGTSVVFLYQPRSLSFGEALPPLHTWWGCQSQFKAPLVKGCYPIATWPIASFPSWGKKLAGDKRVRTLGTD